MCVNDDDDCDYDGDDNGDDDDDDDDDDVDYDDYVIDNCHVVFCNRLSCVMTMIIVRSYILLI